MNVKEFNKVIGKRISILRSENEKALNNGNKNKYQINCNELKGISFVMQRFKQIKRLPK